MKGFVRGDHRFFKSRLARRFFGMFVLCALVPICALAAISYYRVTRQLTDQALDRLRQSAKSHGLSIYERLLQADRQLEVVQEFVNGRIFTNLPPSVVEQNRRSFSWVALIRDGKIAASWEGEAPADCLRAAGGLDATQRTAAMETLTGNDGSPEIAIFRRVEHSAGPPAVLVGGVKQSFLWGFDQGTILPPSCEFAVWDDHGRRLFSSRPLPVEMDRLARIGQADPTTRTELTIDNELYYAKSWSLFLKPKFHVPSWTVTVMEPRGYVLGPARYFRTVFPAVILLSLAIVVWLSNKAIRKSLIPIESLAEGARHVSRHDFNHRVVVDGGDEFSDLATAFNDMTGTLDMQFKTLAARADLDATILAETNLQQVIVKSLTRSDRFFPCRTTAVSILDAYRPMQGHSFVRPDEGCDTIPGVLPFRLSEEERRLLDEESAFLRTETDAPAPSYLTGLRHPDVGYYLSLPIRIHGRLFGIFSLGVQHDVVYNGRDLDQLKGFANNLAVAFSNAKLIAELRELNMGALHALAATVDAKSSWTAGHSQRIAGMVIRIGTSLGLDHQAVESLERAALLHDIGKIGIPVAILDKPGRLTEQEYELIKTHPSIGARILSPIKAYAGIIPIVEQHHERYDGKGYPSGLKGDEISLSGRIMAVADAFDAMVSDRPYRKGLGQQRALEILREEADAQFDASVVEAFIRIAERDDRAFAASVEASPNEIFSSAIEPFLASSRETGNSGYREAKV